MATSTNNILLVDIKTQEIVGKLDTDSPISVIKGFDFF